MIEVEHVSKVYSNRKAVDDVSFTVEKGEVLGFLGPNGAGKTTTMRILTCYMPSTEGTARIAGYDVFEESLEVRKRIGYLPENPPVYPEMPELPAFQVPGLPPFPELKLPDIPSELQKIVLIPYNTMKTVLSGKSKKPKKSRN